MIQLLHERFYRCADLGVIVEPAGRQVGFAFDGYFHLKTVTVHLAAFVALGRLRQSLRRFERKIFCQANAHLFKLPVAPATR